MKAIETRYAGCHFRSRTEARWAVFLDAIGYEWEFEPEGFELNAGRYLPDFWLPNQKKWLEIKGTRSNLTDRDWARWFEFGRGRWDLGERFSVLTGTMPRSAKQFPIESIVYSRPPERYTKRLDDLQPGELWGQSTPGEGNRDAIIFDDQLIEQHGEAAAGFMLAGWHPFADPDTINHALNAARSHRFGT